MPCRALLRPRHLQIPTAQPSPCRHPSRTHPSLQPSLCACPVCPRRFSVPELSRLYRIRQQRVMAILALKEMEEKAEAAGEVEEEDRDFAAAVEEALGATYTGGVDF